MSQDKPHHPLDVIVEAKRWQDQELVKAFLMDGVNGKERGQDRGVRTDSDDSVLYINPTLPQKYQRQCRDGSMTKLTA